MMSESFLSRAKKCIVYPMQLRYKNQTRYLFDVSQRRKEKPLVVILPWWGAPEKAILKYEKVYENAGCDVIVKKVQQIDFLRPNLGLKKSKEFLLDLEKVVASQNCPLIFHCTSIGCYFYALMLIHLKDDPYFYNFAKSIKAQILDSPVVGTLNEMATGVANNTTSNKFAQNILKTMVLCYFSVTKPFTIKLYNQSIEVIKYNPPKIPSLLITSDNDPLALPHSFMSFVDAWKDIGVDVTWKVWKDSKHAQHLRYHPDEYISLVQQTLSKALDIEPKINSQTVLE